MTQSPGEDSAVGVPTCYRHPDRETYIRCQRCERPICPDCMRDAAVGFQCPSCVSEGAKQTRQARTAYGGQRSGDPRITSFVLIGINLLVWATVLATGGSGSRLVALLGLRPIDGCDPNDGFLYDAPRASCEQAGALLLPGFSDGAWWQVLSSQFLHVQVLHIAANMLALYVLGPQIEAVMGRLRFLALYLLSGLAGGAAVLWLGSPLVITYGASGAIYGLFGALVVIAVKIGGDLRGLLGLLAVNLFITFAVPNISWQAHLGGFVGGLLIAGAIVYAPRERRAVVQWLAIGALALVCLALLAVRVVALR